MKVKYSRTTDKYVSLAERTRLANTSGAKAFYSIHTNSFTRVTVRGIETFSFPGSTADAYYKKYADGTMECYMKKILQNYFITGLLGNIYRGNMITVPYLRDFIEEPDVNITSYSEYPYIWGVLNSAKNPLSQVSFTLVCPSEISTLDCIVVIKASGRWK